MSWVLPFIGLVVLECVATILAKEWSLRLQPWIFATSILFYILCNVFWLIALHKGLDLSKGAVLFAVATAVFGASVGVLWYKESLSTIQIAGMGIGILSLVLILWEG